MKTTPYHPGELAVQQQAGTRPRAAHLTQILLTEIPPQARPFLARQPLIVVGSADDQGRLWASILTGVPGFLQAADAHTLHIAAQPVKGDMLAANLHLDAAIGTLVVDFEHRQRLRLNGRAHLSPEGIRVALEEAFFLCPKYIQARTWLPPAPAATSFPAAVVGPALTAQLQTWIERADTFFLATAHAGAGLDVANRGGLPGFVRVVNELTLHWPDYPGNGMFQSLGNLALNPRAGLLFPDFATGQVLQLTGQAYVDWSPGHARRFPGAERVVVFKIEEARTLPDPRPLRWIFDSYSPFNPPVASEDNPDLGQ